MANSTTQQKGTVSVTGLTECIVFLKKLEGNLAKPPASLLDNLAQDLREAIAKEFSTETDLYGDPWKSLSKATLDIRKSKRISSRRILDVSGDLKRSIEVKVVSPNKISIGFSDSHVASYALVHQFGASSVKVFGKGRPTTIPARPFLPQGSIPDDIFEKFCKNLMQVLGTKPKK